MAQFCFFILFFFSKIRNPSFPFHKITGIDFFVWRTTFSQFSLAQFFIFKEKPEYPFYLFLFIYLFIFYFFVLFLFICFYLFIYLFFIFLFYFYLFVFILLYRRSRPFPPFLSGTLLHLRYPTCSCRLYAFLFVKTCRVRRLCKLFF